MTTDARPPSTLAWLGVAEGAALIRARELSPLDWTQALLARIEGTGQPIDAFLHVAADSALARARTAEDQLAAGHNLGPLHGVPCAIKDIIATADMPTTAHSRVLIGHQPAADATIVRRLRQAGAVLLGKTATHEFAHGGPATDLPWPPARNPWNLAHFSGGSSSGSGAALAGGLAPAALGTDTGGSIRIPAGLCGVTGLKPTYGRVSRSGIYALSPALDTAGPMARSARDCALLLQAIAGHDPGDPASARVPVADFAAALVGHLKDIRIGVPRHFFESDLRAHPEAAAALARALEVLSSLGARIEAVTLAPMMDFGDVRVLIQEAEAFAIYHALLREDTSRFGQDFLGRVLPGCLVPAFAQSQAHRKRRMLVEQMAGVLQTVDALVTVGSGPAPRFDARETHGFLYGLWSDKPNLLAPFSVTGFPTLSVCNGFATSGLPTSMQIAGRAWDDATVLRIGDAFQQVTDWHQRHPADPVSPGPVSLAPPEPAEALDSQTIAWADACIAHADLRLTEAQRLLVLQAAPRVKRMIARLGSVDDRSIEPAAVFRLDQAGD